MWLLASVNCYVWSEHPFGISLLFLFLSCVVVSSFCCVVACIDGCWLESSVRGFRVFREVFVLFSVWIVLCPPEGSILSLSIQCLAPFLGSGRNYRTCMSQSSGFATSMRKNSGFLRFFDMGFDLTTSGRERFRYPLYYWSC